jgi:3'-phosphoadenosine 5'-phosphosulfate sulfotransferase (PAPS reductase)/FAD synthetase
MTASPYKIEGPAIISFSGGRTSGYMLHKIVEAHGGTLPDDVVVTFANTGKEREETLAFVDACGINFGVDIRWLEFVTTKGPKPDRFREVRAQTASRNGEPFAALIAYKNFAPNSMMRFCTEELKVNTIRYFAEQRLNWKTWKNVVGLRHDEGHRCLKAYARNETGKSPWITVCPMDKARDTKRDVMDFWAAQPFDLGLKGYEGNCDMCFLKGRKILRVIEQERPGTAKWWADQETPTRRFNKDESYSTLAAYTAAQPHLFDTIDDEYDAECGLVCVEQ